MRDNGEWGGNLEIQVYNVIINYHIGNINEV